jgi:hypothetical protein
MLHGGLVGHVVSAETHCGEGLRVQVGVGWGLERGVVCCLWGVVVLSGFCWGVWV